MGKRLNWWEEERLVLVGNGFDRREDCCAFESVRHSEAWECYETDAPHVPGLLPGCCSPNERGKNLGHSGYEGFLL